LEGSREATEMGGDAKGVAKQAVIYQDFVVLQHLRSLHHERRQLHVACCQDRRQLRVACCQDPNASAKPMVTSDMA